MTTRRQLEAAEKPCKWFCSIATCGRAAMVSREAYIALCNASYRGRSILCPEHDTAHAPPQLGEVLGDPGQRAKLGATSS